MPRKTNQKRNESFRDTTLSLQNVQHLLYARPETARIFRRNEATCAKNVLFRRKRSRRRESLGHEQSKCVQLDKKNEVTVENFLDCAELDELYWYIGRKRPTEIRKNVYIMTAVSRNPRQVVEFDAAFDKSAERIQNMVDAAPPAKVYYTDGYSAYMDVVYPGYHARNVHDKSDTFTVESVNADLRHYIPILARRSRCFPRKIETLQAVLEVFVDAYNRFGAAKKKFRRNRDPNSRELPFSVIDFL